MITFWFRSCGWAQVNYSWQGIWFIRNGSWRTSAGHWNLVGNAISQGTPVCQGITEHDRRTDRSWSPWGVSRYRDHKQWANVFGLLMSRSWQDRPKGGTVHGPILTWAQWKWASHRMSYNNPPLIHASRPRTNQGLTSLLRIVPWGCESSVINRGWDHD